MAFVLILSISAYTLLKHKHRAEILSNKVETLELLYQDAQDRISEDSIDIRECQKSYDDLLLDLNLVSDSLVECRKGQVKVIPTRKPRGRTKLVRN